MDTVSWTHVGEGLQHRNVIRWLSALPAVHNGGGFAVCRPWEAKGGALQRLRPATEPQLIVVSESGNPQGLTLVILLRQRTGAGWEHEKGAGRGIRRGKREEGSVGREMCVS